MRLSLVVCSILVLGGCSRGGAGAPAADSSAAAAVPEGHLPVARATALPSAAQAAIDSANTRYAERDYTGALAGYRRALAAAPGHPAPWWGIAMAANMLGDSVLADSARRILESRGVKPETEHGAGPKLPASPHGTPM